MVVNDKLISGGEPKIIKIRPVISKKNYFILPDGTTNEASYIQIYYIYYILYIRLQQDHSTFNTCQYLPFSKQENLSTHSSHHAQVVLQMILVSIV